MAEPALAPGLYLVATPIGNLEDITLRALRVLRQVDLIACEDTRQTQKLLNHFQITTPTVSYHLFNEQTRSEELVTELKAGGRIAVVSDAGTPGISDPGSPIAEAAIEAGIPVFPVPGANAAISALIASGLKPDSFLFHGFLTGKTGERRTALEGLARQVTHIFYESPHRVLETLSDIAQVIAPGQPVVVARELTKLHEEFLRGPVEAVSETLQKRERVRGEIVLLLRIEEDTSRTERQETISEQVRGLMKAEQISEMDALKRVARDRGMGKSEAYREFQREQNRRPARP